jgi:hypothetical protein
MPKPTRSPITTTAVPCQIRAADGDGVRRFTLEAYTGEPMRIWPYDWPVVIDLASVDLSVQRVPALYDHVPDADYIVGQVESVRVSDGKIIAAGIFTPTGDSAYDRNYCRKVLDRADAGYVWQCSVGGNPKKIEDIPAGQSIDVNGRSYAGPVSVARGLSLREISFVVLGGDRLTSAVVSRSKPNSIQGAAMSFEDWLTSMGFDSEAQTTMTEVQTANMKKMYADEYGEGEETDDPEAAPTEDVTNAEADVVPDEEEDEPTVTNARAKKPKLTATAELKRSKAILAATKRWGNPMITVNGQSVTVAAHAIEQGWTPDQAELKAMRSQLVQPPPPIIRGGGANLQSLQGAMLLRAGGRLDHKGYTTMAAAGLLPNWLRASINDDTRNRAMEEAHRLSKLSAVDICREALRASGHNVPHDRDEMIRAAFSTASLSNVMTTSMNAILIATYLDSPDTTVGWVKENDVANYLLQERPRVQKGAELSPLPEGGEADHDTMNDVRETYKVERFARQFAVDEIAIINDSLGAIGEKPVEFGRAAARVRPNLVYAMLLANPTLAATGRALFNATDGNANTSAALAAATLSAGLAEMATIRENGVNIDVTPSHLIVPFALRDTAVQLTGSPTIVVGGTAGTVTQVGVKNPLNDWGLFPVPEKRLDNGVTNQATGVSYSGSNNTWYLASNLVPPFEVGYLRGSGRAPRVRSWVYDKEGRFGVGWDVSITVGVCPLDWRGIQRNAG